MEGTLDFPPWVDLPDPVTELILGHLPLPDYIRFAAVCRKWGLIQKDHRLHHSPYPPPMGTHSLPWLIRHDIHLGTGLDCYSPLEKRLHRLRFPTTPTFPHNTLCMASSGGWLLMLDDDAYYNLDLCDYDPTGLPIYRSPFLFNPLTRAVISLPTLQIVPRDQCFGALSSPPFDPDCTILLVSGGHVFLCRSNDPGDGWNMWKDTGEWIDSAVYCSGKFYFISRKGVLHVIDHGGKFYCISKKGVLYTWWLMPLTMDVSTLDLRDGNRCRLVEFGGELLLIMELYNLHHCLEGFQVFMADFSGEKWVKKMDMLADHVLFLDERCSLSLLASDVGCKKNCIYYTHKHGAYVWGVFDLDTRNWIDEEAVTSDRFSRFIDDAVLAPDY